MQVGHYVLPLSSNECKTTSSVFEELLMHQLLKVFSVSKSLQILKRKDYHRRTGQEILGGGGADVSLSDSQRRRVSSGGILPRENFEM